MNRFMDRLRIFMSGRNGTDELSVAVLILSLIISLVGQLLGWIWLILLSYAGWGYCIFRMFSRNIYKRRKENEWISALVRKMKSKLEIRRKRFRDRNTFRYFKCPSCKNWLKVPKGKGKIDIKCAKCGKHIIRST